MQKSLVIVLLVALVYVHGQFNGIKPGQNARLPGGGSFKVPEGFSPEGFKIPDNFKGSDLTIPGGFQVKIGNNSLPKSLDDVDYIDPRLVDSFTVSKKYEKNGEETCLQFGRRMLAVGLPAFNECMKEMTLSIGKLRSNIRQALPCVVKCMGIKLNILHADGTFNFEFAQDLLKREVPPRLMDLIDKIWNECKPHAMKINPNDATCKSYRPVIHCGVNSAFKVATEAMKLCPDIPDVFKKVAKSFIKSKKQREVLDHSIAIHHEDDHHYDSRFHASLGAANTTQKPNSK